MIKSEKSEKSELSESAELCRDRCPQLTIIEEAASTNTLMAESDHG